MPELKNRRAELFCHEFMVDLDQSAAYQRAGFRSQGRDAIHAASSRLLAKPEVKQRIAELMAERTTKIDVTAEDVIRDLLAVKNKCMGLDDIPAFVVVDGVPVDLGAVRKFDAAGANKALELIGKHLRMWVDRLEVAKSHEDWLDEIAD